jgi:hypothetical protein
MTADHQGDVRFVDQLRRLGSLRPSDVALLFIITAVGARVAWLSRTWFKEDDLLYLYRAATSDLGLSYLFVRRDGHLMPGAFAVVWVMQQFFRGLWWPVVVFSAVALAVAGWLTWRVLVSLVGERYGLLPLLAVALWSPLTLAPTMWWAAGMQLLPLLVGFPSVILLVQRYLRDRTRMNAFWPMLALAATLAFFEKAVLVAFFVTALCAAVPLAPDAGATVFERLRRAARPLVLMHVAVAAMAAIYVLTPADQDATPEVTLGQIHGAGWNLVIHSFLPSLVGGPWRWTPPRFADPPQFGLVAASIAVLALLTFTIVRFRRVARLWLLISAYVAADIALVSVGRVGILGPITGLAPRYAADAVFPAVVVLTLVLFGSRFDTQPRVRVALVAPWPPLRSSQRLIGAVVISLVLTLSATVSSVGLVRLMAPAGAKTFVERAVASVGSREVEILDGPVPDNVLSILFTPDNRASVVLTPASPSFRFVEYSAAPHIVGDSGEVVRAQVGGVEAELPEGSACLTTVMADAPSVIELPQELFFWNWYVTFEYVASQPSYLLLSLGPEAVGVPLEALAGSFTLALPGEGNNVQVGVLGGPVCVTRFVVGVLEPVPDAGEG